jgi:hypothetical protein
LQCHISWCSWKGWRFLQCHTSGKWG